MKKNREILMQNLRAWKKIWFVLALLVLGMLLSSCASMEEKRDKFMADGKASYEKGDYVTARLHFKNALQLDPKLAEGYLWLGKTELRLKNPRGAFGSLSKAVELNPDLLEAQIILGNLYLLGKRTDEAEAKVKLVLEKEPNDTGALMLSAGVALAKEQPQEAQEILKKIIGLDPHKVEAFLMQSAIEVRQKKLDAAAAVLDEGIKANPKAVTLYLAGARLAEKQKQLDQAETILKNAEKVAPKNIKVQDELVRLYMLKKQGDKVEEALRRRITLEPDDEAHIAGLARFLSSQGRFAEGEKVLKDFIAKHPDNQKAKFALANYYLSNRKFGRGERILMEIIKKDPSGPTGINAKGQLAVLRLTQGQQEEAQKLVEEVLKENPKDMTALKLQGLIALSQKDGLKAVSNFRILTQDQPENEENWLLLARAHQISNEKQLAKEAAKKALDLKPDYREARVFLYSIYLQDKEYDELVKLIKEYLRADEKDMGNWSALGDVYVRKGDDKEARAAFQKMIDLEPKNPQGYIKMAMLARKNKQPEEAARYLKTALKQNPNYPTLRLLLALYQEENQPKKALEAAQAAVAQSPKNAELRQILGEVLLAQKQPEAAATALEEALTLNPHDAQALGLLIRAYQGCPDKAERIRKLEQKAEDPQAPVFYAMALAQLYERQQQGDKAIALYDQLLKRPGAPVMVKNNLAYLLAEYQPTAANLERAQKIATEILDDNPKDPRLLDTLGWIYCKQKNYAEAKKYLTQAVDRAPKHPILQYHLGFCMAKLGDTAVARQALEKALASENDFPEREEAQKLLKSLSEGSK
jgi:tetratricopeptide (TPR) repeat protein